MKFSTFFDCMSPWAAGYKIPVAVYILFLNITDNEKAVKKGIEYKDFESDDYDNIVLPQRYHKYPNDDFPINTFAHKIYNKGNKDKFMNFLKAEASGSILKEKLYNNFSEVRHELKKEHIFENRQDLFNDIADAFLEILEDAAEEYKNSPRNKPRKASNDETEVLRPAVKANKKEDATTPHPLNSAQAQESEPATAVDDSTNRDNKFLHNTNALEKVSESKIIETIKLNRINTFMTELKDVIDALKDIGHRIASRASNTNFMLPEHAFPYELKSAIQKSSISKTNLYPELETKFKELQNLYDSIDQYNIEHEEELLEETLKLISNIKIDDFIEKWKKGVITPPNTHHIIKLDSLIESYFEDNYK